MNWTKIGFGCISAARQALGNLPSVKVLNNNINIQTNADVVSHRAIIDYLKKQKVSCVVYSEEEPLPLKINNGDGTVVFIVDPVDNTHLYLRGEVSFCSIALMILMKGKPSYSFVGDIATGDVYYCTEKASYKNKLPIRVPLTVPGRQLILGWAPYALRIQRLVENLIGLTGKKYYLYNFGGQLQTAKIAQGSYDAYVEVRAETLNEFCGALIVQRAGGVVTTLQGKPIQYKPNIKQTLLVARNKEIHAEILARFKGRAYVD